MTKINTLSIHSDTKILVPAKSYDLQADKRLLIPYTSGDKIGFVNREGEVIVPPKYSMYYGECYDKADLIRVSAIYTYGFPRAGGRVATYHCPVYGLINYKGEQIVPLEYFTLLLGKGDNTLVTVQNKEYRYGVIALDGSVVVPFGSYHWIDGFDKGLSRVIGCDKWGLINEKGDVVLPVEYDYINSFYAKNTDSVCVHVGGERRYILKKDILTVPEEPDEYKYKDDFDEDYGSRYGEYEGSYAQDVAGYSDDVIGDAFEGDPDAYWNIE